MTTTPRDFTHSVSWILALVLLASCGRISLDIKPLARLPSVAPISLTANAISVPINEGGTGTVVFVVETLITEPTGYNWEIPGGAGRFTQSSGSGTLRPGDQALAISLAIPQDSFYQGNINYSLVVTGGKISKPVSVTIQAIDDELPVSLAIADLTVNESVGQADVVVTLSPASTLPTTFHWATSNGTALAGADYTASSGDVTIPAGSTSTTLSIPILDDLVDEPDKTFTVEISAADGASISDPTAIVTILDDDAAPTIAFTQSTRVVAENAGMIQLNLVLSSQSQKTVTVPYTVSGSATSGSDYSLSAGTLTIAAGQTTASIPLTIIDDGLNESNETVIVTLGGPTNADLGTPSAITVTIMDNDGPPTLYISDINVDESEGQATFTVQLTSASGTTVSFDWATSDGTAIAGSDYTMSSGTGVALTPGQTSKTLTIPITDDALYETQETFNVTLSNVVGAASGALTATATIIDNDTAPSIHFATASQSVNEDVGTVTVTVSLSAVSGRTTTAPYTFSGTATGGGVDHNLTAGNLSIPANQTSGTITFNITDDSMNESNETVILTLGSPMNATLGSPTVHTVTISDNDPLPTLNIGDATATEGGTLTFTVTLDAPSGRTVTVNYATSGGTATSGTDFTAASGTLTFSAGVTTRTIAISPINDSLHELDETFSVTLSSPLNATLADDTAVGTITDDDAAPTVEFSVASQAVLESVGSVTIQINQSALSGLATTVPISVSGSATGSGDDYTSSTSGVTIAAGQSSATFTFSIVDDTTHEPDETVIFTIGSPTHATVGTQDTETVTILDNDLTISIAGATVNEADGTATLTITSNVTAQKAASFSWATSNGTATAGSDFTASNGTATIAAGSSSQTITIPITDDGTNCEPDENFTVTISSPSTGVAITAATATVTIVDNDIPHIRMKNVGTLPGIAADFTATMDRSCGQAITFNYSTSDGTATSGTDYTAASGTATIPSGSTTTTINVATIDQNQASSRTFTMSLSNPSGTAVLSTTSVTGSVEVKTFDIDLSSSIPSGVDFSRASMASYTDAERRLKFAAPDEPRFDYDGTTGAPQGLLIENARTNLLPYSQDFSRWSAVSGAVAVEGQASPDGGYNGFLLKDTSTSSQSVFQYWRDIPPGKYTFSIWVKRGTDGSFWPRFRVREDPNPYSYHGVNFTVTGNGTMGTAHPIDSSGYANYGSDWFRIHYSFTCANTVRLIEIFPAANPGSSAIGGIVVFGAQLEEGGYPTSYIPTHGNPVSRAPDRVSVSPGGWFNALGGTLFMNLRLIDFSRTTGASSYLANFNNKSTGGDADHFGIKVSNTSGWKLRATTEAGGAGSIQADITDSATLSGPADLMVAGGFAADDFNFARDGSVRGTDDTGSIPTGIDELAIGSVSTANDTQGANIYARRLIYWRSKLNNASLASITTTTASKPVLYVMDTSAASGQNLVFSVRTSANVSSNTTFNWTLTDGTGTAGVDTSGATSGTATITSGNSSTTITIPTVGDNIVEGDETVILTLSGLPSNVTAGDLTATGIILENTLDVNFLTTQMPTGMRHFRSTTASYFDATGVIKYTTVNLALQSQQFTNSVWTAEQARIVPGQVQTPDGLQLGAALIEDATSNVHGIKQNISGIANNNVLTYSLYLKKGTTDYVRLLTTDKAGVSRNAWFNVASGTVGTTDAGLTANIASAGSGWYRARVTFNSGATGSGALVIGAYTAQTDGVPSHQGTAARYTYIWNAQLEPGSAATDYIWTGSAINYGPRFDYDPGRCEDGLLDVITSPSCPRKLLGLLVEPAATNYLLSSENLLATDWVADTGISATSSGTLAGLPTFLLTKNDPGNLSDAIGLAQRTSLSGNINHTLSFFVKDGTASRVFLSATAVSGGTHRFRATFDLATGTSSFTFNDGFSLRETWMQRVNDGWRISMSFVPNANIAEIDLRIGPASSTLGDSIHATGAQLVREIFPTSYIPTTVAQASRTPEAVWSTYFNTFNNSSNFSHVIEFSRPIYETTGSYEHLLVNLKSSEVSNDLVQTKQKISGFTHGTDVTNAGTTTTGSSASYTGSANAVFKVGTTVSSGIIKTYQGGSLQGTSSTVTVPRTDTCNVGDYLAGHLRRFQYTPFSMTDARMNAATN